MWYDKKFDEYIRGVLPGGTYMVSPYMIILSEEAVKIIKDLNEIKLPKMKSVNVTI